VLQLGPTPFSIISIMKLHQANFAISTRGRGPLAITGQVGNILRDSGVQTGLCQVFCQHTSASLVITENADPLVLRDMEGHFTRHIPDGDPRYEHDQEGPDDMSAHIRSVLTDTGLMVPISHGRLALGTWQGIFLWEHRARGQVRNLVVTCLGL
jgi:secondary thiamine-phosphate synthase enzyme